MPEPISSELAGKARLLLAEDDLQTLDTLAEWLSGDYEVEIFSDGLLTLEAALIGTFDLLVLDVGLPSLDGMTVCRRYRESGGLAKILLLTGRNSTADKVEGLDSGGDDYLTKPFSLLELSARLKALLRRKAGFQSNVLQVGGLSLGLKERKVSFDQESVDLSPQEFALLEFFMRHKGQIFSQEELISKVWGSVRKYLERVFASLWPGCEGRWLNLVRTAMFEPLAG
ncbi:MAG: response regulator transcription factor [Candidatus Obscuribacter sp.]|nr:response regulator transcription factor [Candidatus Obscuribacter sp.]